jgi:hypothetical protein
MTTTHTPKTDRERFHYTPPRGAEFLHEAFGSNRNADFLAGMKAFAQNWFDEFSDEKHLPDEWHRLVAIAEEWMLFDDVTELCNEEDDEDE